MLADLHHAGIDLVDACVGDPLDVALAQLLLQQPPGIAHAAQSHVADVRLRRDERHRHPIAQFAPAQIGVEDHRELVGRAEAARPLRSTDHHRAGRLQECLVGLPGGGRMGRGADRLRVPAERPQPRNLVEGQARAGGDDQVVVLQLAAILQQHAVLRRMDRAGRRVDERDVVPAQRRRGVDLHVGGLAPADADPRVGWREREQAALADHRDAMGATQRVLDFIGGTHAAQTRTNDDDVAHGRLLLREDADSVRHQGRGGLEPGQLGGQWLVPARPAGTSRRDPAWFRRRGAPARPLHFHRASSMMRVTTCSTSPAVATRAGSVESMPSIGTGRIMPIQVLPASV